MRKTRTLKDKFGLVVWNPENVHHEENVIGWYQSENAAWKKAGTLIHQNIVVRYFATGESKNSFRVSK